MNPGSYSLSILLRSGRADANSDLTESPASFFTADGMRDDVISTETKDQQVTKHGFTFVRFRGHAGKSPGHAGKTICGRYLITLKSHNDKTCLNCKEHVY